MPPAALSIAPHPPPSPPPPKPLNLDHIPAKLRPTLFTPDAARAAGIKSGQTRRSKPFKFIQIIEKTVPPPVPPDPSVRTVKTRLAMLDAAITNTRDALANPAMDDKARAQLLKAFAGLIDLERILLGVPNPGTSRQSRGRESGPSARPGGFGAGPVLPQVAPVAIAAPAEAPGPAAPDVPAGGAGTYPGPNPLK